MKNLFNLLSIFMLFVTMLTACNTNKTKDNMETFEKGTFGYDLAFLSKRDSLVVLTNKTNAQVIVSPKYQGKVFTSSVSGTSGASLGFVKHDAFDYDEPDAHMNAFGGENRFWLGPEGGKYSVYFKPGVEQVFDNWHTPKAIDIEPWTLLSSTANKAEMTKDMEVVNYQGSKLRLRIERSVELYENKDIEQLLKISINPAVQCVGYKTNNVISNQNDFAWTKETGTICTWMLDMFNPAPKAVTIIPFNEGSEEELGTIATTNYFGEIPSDRLAIKDGVLYLKTDGKFRSKLGMNAKRTKAIAGNYDPQAKRLTITTYDVEKDATYLNQEWNPTKDPLVGDAMNAYNDGPLEDGSIMGPFLELESVSPAAFLQPKESQAHVHSVFHFIGEMNDLDPIAETLLGVSLQTLENIF